MKIKQILKEVFDLGLFKKNIRSALSTINSEMDGVEANLAELDKASKQKEEENERLKKTVLDLNARIKAVPQQKTAVQTQNTGLGTTRVIGTREE